jgi:hypothetical protein
MAVSFFEAIAIAKQQRPRVVDEGPDIPIQEPLGDVTEILAAWRRVFGMKLDREHVTRHLVQLADWPGRIGNQ